MLCLASSVGGIWLIKVAPATTVNAIEVKMVRTTSTVPITYFGMVLISRYLLFKGHAATTVAVVPCVLGSSFFPYLAVMYML